MILTCRKEIAQTREIMAECASAQRYDAGSKKLPMLSSIGTREHHVLVVF